MPLENATYINQLVVTNPAPSDGMNGADDHMRLTKAAIKNTFPNITGVVNATQGDLNNLVGGVPVLSDGGAFFKTSGDGFKNTLTGDIDVWIGGQIGATFQNTAGTNFFKVPGQIQATSIVGAGMAPIGSVLIWPSDTLPPSNEGVWVWCNGAIYSKATYATYYARMGGSVDASNFAVPNYQEVTLTGKSSMGGAASPGLLTTVASQVKSVIGQLFGYETTTLLRSDLPNVAPSFTGIQGTVTVSGTFVAPQITNTFNTGTQGNPCIMGNNTTYGVTSSGFFTPQGNVGSINGGVAQTSTTNLSPTRTTAFIIRLA